MTPPPPPPKTSNKHNAAVPRIVFMPRAERERLALERRQKEVEEMERRRQSIPTGAQSMRHDRRNEGADKKADKKAGKRPPPEDTEATMTWKRYMGPEPNQSTFSAAKKRKRTTEKKFNFGWDEDEDTSYDCNPIYQHKAEASFFGRGRLGGLSEGASDANKQQYIEAMIERDPETGRMRAAQILDMEKRDRRRQGLGDRTLMDTHWSKKKLEHMRERDWRIFKEDFNITTTGGAIPNPLRTWKEAKFPATFERTLEEAGYTEPSAIQRAAIPIALEGRDLIGVAITGSGKTAAFILPMLVFISQKPPLTPANRHDGPYALILAPTRELAQQIESEVRKFAAPLGFNTAVIVGGHSIEEQSFQMQIGAEIIIATPGRLVDCIERRVLVLSQCTYVIMDEADRMIDMGFEEPVNKILDALPVNNEKPDSMLAEDPDAMKSGLYRQTMMYTATMPAPLRRIAQKYLRRPATVMIGNVGEAVDTVEQRVEQIQGEERRKKRLQQILGSGEFSAPIIVFVNVKRNCEAMARAIKQMGFSSVTLHGSKTQEQREAALASLKEGRADVLVATDLAGRGIDITDVSLVVNFNMAVSIESYTHRIGRTGRAGKSGVAITFWGNEDADVLYDLKQMLMKSQISKVPEDLRKHEAAQQKGKKRGEVMGKAIT